MIKFFRAIRKDLMEKNKTGKYLKYAIGEIVLVVIGILIALSINNWNQNQKDRKLGDDYLLRITSELEMDKSILNQKITLADKLSSEYLDFIRKMYEAQKNKEDFIRLSSSTEWNVDELILIDIAYSEMVSTGKFDLIRNSSLKDEITKYYRNYEFVASRVKELNSSNLAAINAAGLAAPNMKYAFQGYLNLLPLGTFSKNDYMFNDSDWAYINSPKSIEFRLLEDAVYYYCLKQLILKPMFIELLEQADVILKLLHKENKGLSTR